MSCKRKGGFVFVVLALFVFSGFFVSALSFSDFFSNLFGSPTMTGHVVAGNVAATNYSYTMSDSLSNWIGTSQYRFVLPHQMVAQNVTLVVGSLNAQNCLINISFTSVSTPGETVYSSLVNRTVKFIPIAFSGDVNNITISSAGSCNIWNVLDVFNISIIGQYPFLEDSVQYLTPTLAPNNQINYTLSPELDINEIKFNYKLSSISSCIVNVSTLTGTILKQVGSFNLNNMGQVNRDYSYSISVLLPTKNSKIVISSTKNTAGAYCYNSIINFTNISVVGKNTAPIGECTSFDYSNWSECINDIQNRTILTSSPSGCIGGTIENLSRACNVSSNTTCTDSDSGLNYYVRGELNQTFNQIPHSDYCVNSSVLNEWSCILNDTFRFDEYICPNGCVDGACVNVTDSNTTCTDSDGGLNYGVKGTVVTSDGIGVDKCSVPCNASDPYSAMCNSSSVLLEYYCTNEVGNSSFFDCPNGCSDGACVNFTEGDVCESMGKVSNGVQCVENKDCGSGKCRFLTKSGKTSCVQTGFSFREDNKVYFCDINSTFKSSLSVGSECNFNSQCETNFCFRNQTVGKSFCFNLNQASGLREFFIDFVCWFKNMGNATARAQCKTSEMAKVGTAQLGLGSA